MKHIRYARRSFKHFLLFFALILILFNNTIGIYVFNITSSVSVITIVNASKELFLIVLILILFAQYRTNIFRHQLIKLHLVLLLYGIALPSDSSLMPYLISLKETFAITCFYTLGVLLAHSGVRQEDIINQFLVIMIAVLCFSVFDFIFPGILLPKTYVATYYLERFGNSTAHFFFIDGWPQHWYTYLGFDTFVRRMVGPIGDAPTLARLLCIAFVITFFKYVGFKKYIISGIFLLALIPTFSRAAIMFFGVAGSIYFWKKSKSLSVLLFIFLFAFISDILSYSFISANYIRHSAGLELGVIKAIQNPIGSGFGTFGTASVMYGSHQNEEMIAESFWGGLAAQLGIVGLILWYLPFMSFIFKGYKKKKMNLQHLLLTVTIFGSFLSNMSISTAAAFLPVLLFGYQMERYYYDERTKVGQRLQSANGLS